MKTTSTCTLALRVLTTSIAATCSISSAIAQSPLFTYGFSDVANGLSGTTSSGLITEAVVFGDFTSVGTPAQPNATGRFSFTSWSVGATTNSNVFTGGIDLAEYYEVTLTPQTGFSLDLDYIDFVLQRSSTGIRQYSVRSSLDGFGANLMASINSTDLDLSVVNTPTPNIFQVADSSTTANNGSRISLDGAFSSLTAPVTFRFYGWNAEASSGTFSIDDVAFTGLTSSTFASLVWNPNNPQWDTTATNWLNGATPSLFSAGSAVTFTDAGMVGGGIVQIDAAGVNPRSIQVQNTTGTYQFEGGPIAGNATLTKTGDGILSLTAPNTFAGSVFLNGGVVRISADDRLGTAANPVTFAGGKLEVAGDVSLNSSRNLTGLGDLHVDGGKTLVVEGEANFASLVLRGAGTVELAGGVRSVGAITFEEAGSLASTGTITATGVSYTQVASTATIAANLDLGAATRTVIVADGAENVDLSIGGSIKLTGGTNNRLHKLGTGTLRLEGDNSGLGGMEGSIRIGTAGGTPAAGGTVVITNNRALGGTSDNTLQLQFNDGVLRATEDMTGANAIALGLSIGAGQGAPATFAGENMEFTGPVNVFKANGSYGHKAEVLNTTIFSGEFNISANNGTSTGLTITGDGALVIAGETNANDVPILVDGPTLVVNGALTDALATVTVVSGTLSGNGFIAGDVEVLGGGILAPGFEAGMLSFGGALDIGGAVEDESSGALRFQLGDTNDIVTLTGARMLSIGIEVLEFDDFLFSEETGFGPGTYTLFSTSAPIDGSLGALVSGPIGDFTGTISFTDGNSALVLTVVPEPGSAALLLGGIAMLANRRRRN